MSDLMALHTPHLKSKEVGELQALLKKHGWYHGLVDDEFGLLTYQAVYRAWYWLGRPRPLHVAGPHLLSYLNGHKTPLRYRMYARLRRRHAHHHHVVPPILVEARKHLGTRESPPGSNRVLFSLWYGIIGPWCAMFVSYCGVQAKLKSFVKGRRYAYVPFVVADARAGRDGLTLVTWEEVRPGDLVCYVWGGPGSNPNGDHIGIFEEKVSEENFNAIEGNTSIGNDSNGGEVMRRERDKSLVVAFVRVRG